MGSHFIQCLRNATKIGARQPTNAKDLVWFLWQPPFVEFRRSAFSDRWSDFSAGSVPTRASKNRSNPYRDSRILEPNA